MDRHAQNYKGLTGTPARATKAKRPHPYDQIRYKEKGR